MKPVAVAHQFDYMAVLCAAVCIFTGIPNCLEEVFLLSTTVVELPPFSKDCGWANLCDERVQIYIPRMVVVFTSLPGMYP